jgi:hypothetical protein
MDLRGILDSTEKRKFLPIPRNWTMIPRLSNPYSGQYTDWTIPVQLLEKFAFVKKAIRSIRVFSRTPCTKRQPEPHYVSQHYRPVHRVRGPIHVRVWFASPTRLEFPESNSSVCGSPRSYMCGEINPRQAPRRARLVRVWATFVRLDIPTWGTQTSSFLGSQVGYESRNACLPILDRSTLPFSKRSHSLLSFCHEIGRKTHVKVCFFCLLEVAVRASDPLNVTTVGEPLQWGFNW